MEILKVQLNDKQTLIAYCRSSGTSVARGRASHTEHHVDFKVGPVDIKVGPNSADRFVDCSPDAAVALLAMLDRQEKLPTP